MQLLLILLSTFAVSVISLIGVLTLAMKEKFLNAILFLLVAFSAGALMGGAFLHLIPEAIEKGGTQAVFIFVLGGFVLFFFLEKYLFWRHCHDGVCHKHAFTYLNIAGDSLHNFIDGLVIAGSFSVSTQVGFFTTLLVIFHEIPQELGDFGVLVYGGFSKARAVFFNLLSAAGAILGAGLTILLTSQIQGFTVFLVPFAAGNFIYIAMVDLIPEIHRVCGERKLPVQDFGFILGSGL